MKQQKYYQYKLKTLTPIHIGMGEEFQPTNSIIFSEQERKIDQSCLLCGGKIINGFCSSCDEPFQKEKTNQSGEKFLYTFTPKDLMNALDSNEKAKLFGLSKQNDWQAIRDFFIDHKAKIEPKAHKKALVSDEVFYQYNNMSKETLFSIEKQYCDILTQKPVIPGSSLKGAIRTALLNRLAYKGCWGKKANELEKIFLNYDKINEDPLSNLKISDAMMIGETITRIVKQVNKNRFSKKTLAPSGILEIIPAETAFEGTIVIDPTVNIVNPILLIKNCQSFYQKELQYESSYASKCISTGFYEKMNEKQSLPANITPIRIGKHSGAECVTIEGYRQIGRFKKQHPDTFWVAKDDNKELPFGWAVLQINEVK